MKFFKEITLFQKIFFIFFLIASVVVFLLPLVLTKASLSTIFQPLSILGFFSIICGIFVSIYTAKARPIAYVWWWGSTLAMAIICFSNGLYGQFIQNLFFTLPIQIYGFFAWEKNLKKSSELEIRKMKFKNWTTLGILMVLCWVGYGLFLKYLPTVLSGAFNVHMKADPQIILDAFTAMVAIIAAVLTDLRFIEQWYFWIIYNIVAIIIFVIQLTSVNFGDMSMFIASLSNTVNLTQYAIGVIYGYILWRKDYKLEQKKPTYKEI